LLLGTDTILNRPDAAMRGALVTGAGMFSVASASPERRRFILASGFTATRKITRSIAGRPRKKSRFAASSTNSAWCRRTQR
jgi:hypothetical protein